MIVPLSMCITKCNHSGSNYKPRLKAKAFLKYATMRLKKKKNAPAIIIPLYISHSIDSEMYTSSWVMIGKSSITRNHR